MGCARGSGRHSPAVPGYAPAARSRPAFVPQLLTPACLLPASAQGEKAQPEQLKVVIGGQELDVAEVHVRTQGAHGLRVGANGGSAGPVQQWRRAVLSLAACVAPAAHHFHSGENPTLLPGVFIHSLPSAPLRPTLRCSGWPALARVPRAEKQQHLGRGASGSGHLPQGDTLCHAAHLAHGRGGGGRVGHGLAARLQHHRRVRRAGGRACKGRLRRRRGGAESGPRAGAYQVALTSAL